MKELSEMIEQKPNPLFVKLSNTILNRLRYRFRRDKFNVSFSHGPSIKGVMVTSIKPGIFIEYHPEIVLYYLDHCLRTTVYTSTRCHVGIDKEFNYNDPEFLKALYDYALSLPWGKK